MPSIFVALLDMSQYNRDSDLSMGWTRLTVFFISNLAGWQACPYRPKNP